MQAPWAKTQAKRDRERKARAAYYHDYELRLHGAIYAGYTNSHPTEMRPQTNGTLKDPKEGVTIVKELKFE